jgi:hypothetical protein
MSPCRLCTTRLITQRPSQSFPLAKAKSFNLNHLSRHLLSRQAIRTFPHKLHEAEVLPRRLPILLRCTRNAKGSMLIRNHYGEYLAPVQRKGGGGGGGGGGVWRLEEPCVHTIVFILWIDRLVYRRDVDIVVGEFVSAEILERVGYVRKLEFPRCTKRRECLSYLEEICYSRLVEMHVCSIRVFGLFLISFWS